MNRATATKTNKNGSKSSSHGSKVSQSHGMLLPFDLYVTLPIKKHCFVLYMYSLTLPITFEFKFFHNDTADTSITLNYDPRNINITQVEQTFITLER